MKCFRLSPVSFLISAAVLLCTPSRASEVIAGPQGNRRGLSNWNSLSLHGNLGNVLRLARGTPPKVVGSGDDKFHLWEYVSAGGDVFRIFVHSAARSITGAVCHLGDAAFNALTSHGHEYNAVAVITNDENAIFTVNMAFDASVELQILAPNETDVPLSTERISAPHCVGNGRRSDTQQLGGGDGERSIVASMTSTNDDDEQSGHMRVDGYLGPGCTGEMLYSLRGNKIDFCHRPSMYGAQSFLVVNPKSGPGHLHVYKDKKCRHVVGRILTQTCIPASQYGSFHRQE